MTERPMTVYVTNPEGGEPRRRELPPDAYPSQITVFCDACGQEVTGDYVVHEHMSRGERLGVARDHLRRAEGWTCDETGDYCPACKAGDARRESAQNAEGAAS